MDINVIKPSKEADSGRTEQYAKKGLYFHCWKNGHMVNACPTFPDSPKKPCVQCAQKEEKLPELKEIENDETDEGVAWVSFELDKDF